MIISEENKKGVCKRDKNGHFLRGFPYNKGNTNRLGKKHSEETKRKLSKIKKGKPNGRLGVRLSEETKKKISESNKETWTLEKRVKYSEAQRGEKGSNWQGGLTPINKRVRKSIDFRLWREAIFARDNWTCQATGERGGELHPHHLQNFSQYPELRFAIDNGITLSKKAHEEFHKIYGKQNNTKEQMEEYLNSKNCTHDKE